MEMERKLHPGSHDSSPNVIISSAQWPRRKINKEYVYKYKYIRRRQNVSDRAVNDNSVGSYVKCVFIPLEGNDLYPF